ncbi:MAG: hypothetical protein JSU04_18445 [Bdellovibrionales bacterium]|nr:hypothetical protein [Bdellovibrionales bacterium]
MGKMNFVGLGFVGIATAAVVACSSGGGSGSGGSTTSTSMLQSRKMSCSGAACIGGGSLSAITKPITTLSVSDAVTFYDAFNQQMIPALNNIINIIETGVANAGAESCDDISLSFSGQTSANGVVYNAKTAASSATAPSDFTTTAMAKALSAEIASSNTATIQADVACGAGTDANPLVARVIGKDGTTQLNSWFEKGTTNHIRILMIVKSSGTNYAAWFKTNDGDTFEIVLASGGATYKAVGSKTQNVIQFNDGTTDSCLNATTGASSPGSCGSMATSSITVTGIPNTLTSSATNWASVGSATLISPVY